MNVPQWAKKIACLKIPVFTTPSAIIADLFSPAEGKGHGSAILAMSGLLQTMQRYYYGPNRKLLCISKDLGRKLLAPYNGTQVTKGFQQFYEQS